MFRGFFPQGIFVQFSLWCIFRFLKIFSNSYFFLCVSLSFSYVFWDFHFSIFCDVSKVFFLKVVLVDFHFCVFFWFAVFSFFDFNFFLCVSLCFWYVFFGFCIFSIFVMFGRFFSSRIFLLNFHFCFFWFFFFSNSFFSFALPFTFDMYFGGFPFFDLLQCLEGFFP